jgi:hypothetical protein
MNRLRDEYQPEDWEVDPYDDTLDATERRAAHAAHAAEIDAINAAERYADKNIVDDNTLQPTNAPKGGGRRKNGPKPRKKVTGMVGRPLLDDEARSVRETVRMTPHTRDVLRRTGENTATLLNLFAAIIESGDTGAVLRLTASIASGTPI